MLKSNVYMDAAGKKPNFRTAKSEFDRKRMEMAAKQWIKKKQPSFDGDVYVENTINFKKSMHYNPFVYIRSEKDILKLVTTIIANTKGEGQQAGEDFWVKAEKLYYCALIGYIWYEGREE